jgi:hypothetical protein
LKKFMSIALIICLVCLPLTAWARPQHHPNGFHHEQYSVNISANHGGDVSPRGHLSVRRGESVSIKIRPHNGFVIKRVIVDGRDIGSVRKYKLSRIHNSHRIHVEFAHARHLDKGRHDTTHIGGRR